MDSIKVDGLAVASNGPKLMTSTPKVAETETGQRGFGEGADGSNLSGASTVPVRVSKMFEGDTTNLDQSRDISIVKDPGLFKKDFSSLNKRFASYVERLRENEKRLDEVENARRLAERQLAQVRDESRQQVDMLRTEVEWHTRNSVEAEEKFNQVQKALDNSKQDYKDLQQKLTKSREREVSLERMILSERNQNKALVDENSRLQEQLEKNEKERKDLAAQLTRLKVEKATLQEREKIVSFERTMLESKMAEVDKRLQFSLEDVNKKIDAERRRLEKIGLEKLEETKRKFEADIDRLKKEHAKKLQDTLLTYVCAEEYARLETKHQEALKHAEDAERLLEERQKLLEKARADVKVAREEKEREVATERYRREKLSKKLAVQKQNYNEIRQELDTYRQLIESLDLDGEAALANTPIGSKRARTSLNATFKSFSSPAGPNGTASGKQRQALLRKVLTPKRALKPARPGTSSGGATASPPKAAPDTAEDVKGDCKVM